MNIWASIESEAWERGLDFEGYKKLSFERNNVGPTLSEYGWELFRDLMVQEYYYANNGEAIK